MAAGSARRGGIALVMVLAVVAALAVGGRALWNAAKGAVSSDGCDFGSYNLTLSRAQNASTMVSVVIKRELPERAAVLVLGAAMQESKLDNIPSGQGDRDSVGVLQQRPSQGWGTAEQLSDISYATGKFLDAMVKVPNWESDSLATVVQAVQISADGSAYARHEPQAQAVADALVGKTPAGVACTFDKPTDTAQLTAVATQLSTDLPVQPPAVAGNTISVPGASWATAAWFVSHANAFGITEVTYSGKHWRRSKGWADDASITAAQVRATLPS
ncbi:hypothetical protein ACSMXN_04870 [Jatrophihabitans sp. DSM 45814]